MRRLIAALLLIAALGAPTRPQASLPAWDDSWSGVHSFYVFDPTDNLSHGMEPPVNTCPELAAIASRYDFGWGGGCYPQVKAVNPGFVNSVYTDGTQGGQLLGWYRANHPDWIFYICTATPCQTNPTTPLISYGYSPSPFLYNDSASAVIPDFTNPAQRDYRWTNELFPIANTANAAAIGFDNSLLCNDYAPNPLSINGEYGHAKGNYPNATPANLQAPPFNPKFVGSGCYADILDPPFTNAHIQWFSYLTSQLHALSTPRLSIFNGSPMPIYNSASVRAAHINAIDGQLEEGGNLGPDWAGDSRKLWLGQLRFIEEMNAAGKAVYILQGVTGATTNAAMPLPYIRFVLASYLLAKGRHAAVGLTTEGGYKNTYWPVREFDAANGGVGVTNAVGIGTPCGPMAQTGGPAGTEDGLYVREHSGGISAANASGSTNYPLTLPSGNWTWRDLYNNVVTSPINMTPKKGDVYLKTGMAADIVCSSGSIDSIPPVLAMGPTVDQITSSAARINGVTDEAANWRVDFGSTASYGAAGSPTIDPAYQTTHALTISGLQASTTYHYRVTACDAAGNCANSTDHTFNTLGSPNLTILTTSLPGTTIGNAYSATLEASGGAPSLGFARKVSVTLPHPATTLTDFPHWICKSFNEWKTVANGGQMANDQGFDLVWYADTALTTRLDFVKYRYVPSTGEWCGYVRIPAFAATPDSVIWAAYANTTLGADQGSATAVFSPTGGHIRGHWSMDSYSDSTTTPADLIPSPTPPTGAIAKVNAGLVFGAGKWAKTNAAAKLALTGAHTLCMWVNYLDSFDEALFAVLGDGGTFGLYAADIDPGKPEYFVTKAGALRKATSATLRNTGSDVFLCGGHNGSNVVLNVNGGAEIVTGPAVALPLDIDPNSVMVFGNVLSTGAHACTSCKVDEATLYDQWMGDAWINARYAAENAPAAVSIGAAQASTGGGYTWSIVSGALPAGLALSGNVISGTTKMAGTASFTARVSDGVGMANQALSIVVAAPINVTQLVLPDGIINASYNQLLTATGGSPPFTFTLASGVLPSGLSITPLGLQTQLRGTLTAMGFYVFSIRATDAVGSTQSVRYQMAVGSPTGISYSPLALNWNFTSGTVSVRYSYDCITYGTLAANLGFSQTPYIAMLPQSPTLCLKLDSSTEIDVDVPAIKVSGLYVK